jgi:hypothetical protein
MRFSTATGWDDVPFDNHSMIWSMVGEATRAERLRERQLYERCRERRLYFLFDGFIDETTYRELWLGHEAWLDRRQQHLCIWEQFRRHDLRLHDIERSLETRLRAVVDEVFRPLPRNSGVQSGGQAEETDELNLPAEPLTGEAWTQIGFRIQAVLPALESSWSPQVDECAEIRATSADGLHRISLRFETLQDEDGRRPVEVWYVGPQRFRTSDTQDRHVVEYQREAYWPRPGSSNYLDDPLVFEDWRRVTGPFENEWQ